MNLQTNTVIAAFIAASLFAPQIYAKAAPVCQTGKLLDVRETTELMPAVQVGRTRENNSGKEWITVAPPPIRKQTTYVVKVSLDGMIYTARSSGDFWGYNPANMIVNSEVPACVDSNRLVIARPDGKQYKPTIIRRERDPSSH